MSLRALISSVDEVLTIEHEVSLDLEVTKILKENPTTPVFFKNLKGSKAVGNLWGERERVASSLNMDNQEIQENMLQALESPEKTREIDNPPFKYNIEEDFDLRDLPIPRFFPEDGGRYVTAGVAIAGQEKRNISFHRLMLLDDSRFAIRLVPRHLYALHQESLERGEDLPVTFSIGICPSVLLSAALSVEFGQDEMEIGSALRSIGLGEPVEVSKTECGIPVPAHSEYVLEGRITSETAEEGPFVDITGTYDRVREQPVVEIDRVYHRDDPIFHIILPGGMEHFLLMGMPREPMILRTVRQVVPSVHGVRLTEGGCCWLHGVVSITKNNVGDAKNAIMAAFAGHTSMKRVIIVDEDIDVHDDQQVEWALATRFQADRDLVMVKNARGSSLDPSSEDTTTKAGIDATRPFESREFERATL